MEDKNTPDTPSTPEENIISQADKKKDLKGFESLGSMDPAALKQIFPNIGEVGKPDFSAMTEARKEPITNEELEKFNEKIEKLKQIQTELLTENIEKPGKPILYSPEETPEKISEGLARIRELGGGKMSKADLLALEKCPKPSQVTEMLQKLWREPQTPTTGDEQPDDVAPLGRPSGGGTPGKDGRDGKGGK